MSLEEEYAALRMAQEAAEEQRKRDREGHSVEYVEALDRVEALRLDCVRLFTEVMMEASQRGNLARLDLLTRRVGGYGEALRQLIFLAEREVPTFRARVGGEYSYTGSMVSCSFEDFLRATRS